jgi:hypothetical protein
MTFALGILVTVALSALAMAAALSVAQRSRLRGHAETAVAAGILWIVIVMFPVYVLGLTRHLTRGWLAGASITCSLAVLAAALAVPAPRPGRVRALGREAVAVLCLPLVGLREAFRARSLVLVGLVLAAGLIGWTAVCAYYSPSWGQWDALWYHEPITAFTLQNHGFDVVPLPNDGLQKINGYPRLGEMTQLWFVIFTDRRLIDIANPLLAPLYMLVVYVLARRHTADVVAPMGWASIALVAPLASRILQTSYVDIEVAIFVLAAMHFCTRAPFRVRDAWLGVACMSLALGAKVLALVPVAVLSIIALGRLVSAHGRVRPKATLLTLVLGALAMTAVASVTYWRNWIHFHNPLWPDFDYDNDRLGIHWRGTTAVLDPSPELLDLVETMGSIPYSRHLGHATQQYEYGFGTTWALVPLAVLSTFAVWVTAARHLVGGLFAIGEWRMSDATRSAFYVSIVLGASVWLAPTPVWGARYFIAQFVMLCLLVAWAGGRPGFQRFQEGAVAVAVITTAIAFFWQTPRWWYTPSELKTLASIPYPAREVTPAAAISPDLGLASASAVTSAVGIARERDVRRRDVVAFGDADGNFIALFWNNRYDNRVVYVPSGEGFLARVDQEDAVWLYCAFGDPMYAKLKKPNSGWIEVGTLNVEHWGAMFRRAPPPSPPLPP